ncbi:PASK [Cordylochernes scorpioides]|uniref:PASK n=1 Tax=Cordylochernes scorpioides TaxID=51811 RepID=A0ABY6JY06_9ARAC|nr:PASK [Cordylochernes scorpioides]
MKELNLRPQLDSLYPDLVEAVLYPEDRKGFLRRLSPGDKKAIIQILDKLSEHTPLLSGTYLSLGPPCPIMYQVKKLELESDKVLYCLWVCRDGGEPGDFPQDPSMHFQPEDYDAGPYSDHYTTLQQIGKGAFGCVKMGYRNEDGLLVITKFICKSKVYEEAWTFDAANNQRVPMEVHLLTTLKHPNIVEVLDVFENDHFYQVVMEKHGAGMDLFEFIDRSPHIDEGLASYMFRQVVSALTYLHSLNILHRDVKDENIILDQAFHVKLIDFGSAAVMEPGRVFTTFCGTLVYCSPEVLRGQGYRGPELEMWALGVTLYTLVFGENPWQDVEETMAAVLPNPPPSPVSPDLWDLLRSMLHPDPVRRCSLPRCAAHPWTNLPVKPGEYRLQDVINTGYDEPMCPGYDELCVQAMMSLCVQAIMSLCVQAMMRL